MTKTTDTKTKKEKRELQLPITAHERTEYFGKLLTLEKNIDDKTAEMKAATATTKLAVRELSKERRQVRTILETGKMARVVDTTVTYDFKKGTVSTEYKGETVETREMRDTDRQQDLLPKKKGTGSGNPTKSNGTKAKATKPAATAHTTQSVSPN